MTNQELLVATMKQLIKNWLGKNENGDWYDKWLWRIVPAGILIWILI